MPAYDPTPDELEAMGVSVGTGQLQHQLQRRLQQEHWEQQQHVGSESPSSMMYSNSYSPTTTESYLQHQHQQVAGGYDGHEPGRGPDGYGHGQALHYLIPDMPVVPPN